MHVAGSRHEPVGRQTASHAACRGAVRSSPCLWTCFPPPDSTPPGRTRPWPSRASRAQPLPAAHSHSRLPAPRGARDRPPAPPMAPPGFPPPPNPPGGVGMAQAFAEFLREVFLANVDAGLDLPEGMGGFNRPNRLHVVAHGCVTWQFIINRSEVRAQIFFRGACVHNNYDNGVVPALRPLVVELQHDFGGGIIGNGPAGGGTRAIDLRSVLAGGYASPVADWPYISQSAVEAMHRLFVVFAPHLP